MGKQSLEEALRPYDDPIEAMRTAGFIDEPTPDDHARPAEHTNWMNEQMSWKETCYIGYWSFMPDLHVEGPDAMELFSDLSINSFENFDVGQAKHCVQCNENGQVIGDGIMIRMGEERIHTQHLAAWPMYNLETGDYDATAEIHDTFIFQVQGPNSLDVMQSVTDDSLTDVDFLHVKEIDIAGHDVIALRQGMSGEVGFELQGPEEVGEEVWDAVVEAGQEHGLRQLGHRTHNINHLEMCFPTRGHHYLPAIFGEEMTDYRKFLDANNAAEADFSIAGSFDPDDVSAYYRSPVELGWERSISFDHDFVGREALREEVDDPRRTTVTLVWDPADVVDVYASMFEDGPHYKYMEMPYQNYRAIVADSVLKDGQEVGVSAGRGYSYFYREMLSLCTIDVEYSEPGTEVTVVWGEGGNPSNPRIQPHRQKEISAHVAPAPYKEDKRRSDLAS